MMPFVLAMHWVLASAIVFLVQAPAAQTGHELRGVVVAAGGERAAAAEVFVVPRKPWPFDRARVAPIRVESDAEGRFATRVDPSRGYSVWARFGASRRRITAVIEAPDLGRKVRLVETRAPLATRLRLEGLAVWKQLGARDLFAIDGLGTFHRLTVSEEGETVLPTVPGDAVTIAVEDGAGRVLVTTNVWQFEHMRRTIRRNVIQAGFAKDGEQLPLDRVVRRLPPPIRVPIRIEPTGGLGSLRIEHGRLLEPPIENTGPGRYDVLVPESKSPNQGVHAYAFVVRVPGFVTERVGWDYRWNTPSRLPALHSRDVAGGRTPEIRVALAKGSPRRGRLLSDGKPVSGREVVGLAERDKDDWRRAWAFVLRATTSKDGTFTFSDLRATDQLTRIAIAPSDGRRSGIELAAPQDRKPWTIDLARDIRTVDLAIRREDGEPARGARVVLLHQPPTRARERLWPAIDAVADLRGRCRVHLGPKQDALAIVTDTRFAFVTIHTAGEHAVELAPMPAVRGRVVDAQDRAVPGAELWMRSSRSGGGATAFERFADRHNHKRCKARCDAHGRFEIRILPGSCDFELAAHIWVGTTRHVSRGGLHVYHDAIDDAVLRIPVDLAKR